MKLILRKNLPTVLRLILGRARDYLLSLSTVSDTIGTRLNPRGC